MGGGTGLQMEKREKAGAAKETKITWGKAEQREKIWKNMRRESEWNRSPF